MPILRNRPPKLCRKASNDTGYVYWNGRQVYMGKWGETADLNYRKFLSRWASNPMLADARVEKQIITLEILFAGYLKFLEEQPNYSVSDLLRYRQISARVIDIFPQTPVESFTQIELEAVRDSFQREGYFVRGEHHWYGH